jgi:hypothetical protein
MRGADIHQDTLFGTVSPEHRVPKEHPLWLIRRMVDVAFNFAADLDTLYAELGRDSISAGEAATCPTADGVLHDSQRTSTGRTGRLKPAVSLVRGLFHG